MTRPDYVVSDLHLGAVPVEKERAFAAFLDHVGTHARSLLINGDLFDFWFEYGEVVPGRHFRILARLAELVDAGIPVTYIGGNHDAWGGKFLRDTVGIRFHNGLLRTELGGRNALIAHGDGLGTGDLRYRTLKAFVRNPAIIGLFRLIPPQIGMRIARGASRTEHRTDTAKTSGRAQFLRDWGLGQLATDPALSFVICGHSHLPDLAQAEPGRWYLNAGDWIHHDSYIVIPPDSAPQFYRWTNGPAPLQIA